MEHWVAFPGLGLEFPISQTFLKFEIFGMTVDIRFYGLMIAIGFTLAVIYAFHQAPKLGIDRDRMLDVVLVTAVVAVICARLYYVFFSDNVEYYLSHPDKILAIWDGGLAIYGGIIAAFVVGALMCRLRKVNTLALFDLAAIGFLMGQGLGRWGNFFNQEAYGVNTDLPWGMTGDIIQSGVNGAVEDPMSPVHPTFLYESLWCLLGVLVLHLMFKKLYYFHGQLFGAYLVWYGAERLVVEGLRTDSLFIPGTPIRVSQAVSVAAILGGAMLLFVLAIRAKRQSGGQLQRIVFTVPTAEAVEEKAEEPTVTLQSDDRPSVEGVQTETAIQTEEDM